MIDDPDLAKLLAEYKQADNLAALVALVGDVPSMRVLAIWPNVHKTWERHGSGVPTDANERWKWLWERHRRRLGANQLSRLVQF